MVEEPKYISLQEATRYCSYSQEYLSLLARQGKLQATKIGRNWLTTKEWVKEYLERIQEYNSGVKKNKPIKVEVKFQEEEAFPESLPTSAESLEETLPSQGLPEVRQPRPVFRFGLALALVFVVLIASGVLAFPSFVKQNLEGFSKESFQNAFQEVNLYVKLINQEVDPVRNAVSQGIENIRLVTSDISNGVNEGIAGGLAEISNGVGVFGRAGDSVATGIAKSFKEGSGTVSKNLSQFSRGAAVTIGKIPSFSLARINQFYSGLVKPLAGVFQEIPKSITEISQSLSRGLNQQAFNIQQGIRDFTQSTVQMVDKAGKGIVQGLGGIGQGIKGIGQGIIAGGKGIAKTSLNITLTVWQGINKGAEGIAEGIKGLGQIIEKGGGVIAEGVRGIGQGFSKGSKIIGQGIIKGSKTISEISSGFGITLLEGAKKGLEGLAEGVKGVKGIGQEAKNLVSDFRLQTSEFLKFVTQPFKKEAVVKMEKEVIPEEIEKEITKLSEEIQRLKIEGLPVKEILREVTQITKIEPVKEVTRETIRVDESALAEVTTSLTVLGTKISSLENRTSRGLYIPFSSPAPPTSFSVSGNITEGGVALSSKYLPIPSSSAQGDILYRDDSSWTRLTAGTSGQYLQTQGADANPAWASVVSGLWTDGGAITYLTTTSDDIAMGGTDSSSPFFMDVSEGNLTLTGDLTISGDDLFMGTNTDAYILVADGTNFNPVAMSGDIAITNAGATSIGADKVTEAMLKEVGAAPADEDILTYETTTGDFEWHTPSELITAGDNISWSGTTLNVAAVATAWDDIGDPDAAATIDFTTYTQTIDIGVTDTGGPKTGLILDVTGLGAGTTDVIALQIQAQPDDDTDFIPFRIQDNLAVSAETLFLIDSTGAVTTGTWEATDVALGAGGTGASLTDPNADRIFFWDDGAGTTDWLVANTGLTISGTNLNVDLGTSIANAEIDADTIDFTAIIDSATLDATWALGSPSTSAPTADYDLVLDGTGTGADYDSPRLTFRGNDGAADTELDMSILLDVTSTTDYKLAFFEDGADTEVASLDESGNLQIDGDLTISGDDLFMGTNTDAYILVADGTNFNPVAMSGDIAITNAGATSIGADKVTEAMLKEVGAAPADEDILTYETTTGDFEWHTPSELITAGTNISWSSTTLNVDDAFILNTGDTMTLAAGGSFIIDAATTDNTTTSGVIDLNVDSTTTNNIGFNLDYISQNGVIAAADLFAAKINLAQNDADGDLFGLQISTVASANAGAGSFECLLCLENAENTAGTVLDAIRISSTSGIDTDITDAIDASDSNITNALNIGTNTILSSGSFTIDLLNASADDILTITNSDGSYVANLSVEGHGAFGATGAVSTWATLYIRETRSDEASFDGVWVSATSTYNDIGSPTVIGTRSLASYTGLDTSATIYGVEAVGLYAPTSGTPSATELTSLRAYASTAGATVGTVTSAYGVHIDTPQYGTITPTNSYGLMIENYEGTGVNATYGIYIADQTGNGTNDYGIYIAGADDYAIWVDADDVRFDANLLIGEGSAGDDDFIYFDQSNEFLSWDDDPGEFDLSDDLDVDGGVTLASATPPDLILDNTTTGSDANSGRLYFRGNEFTAVDQALDMSVLLEITDSSNYELAFYNSGAGTEIATLDESGNLQVDGTINAGLGVFVPELSVNASGSSDDVIYFDVTESLMWDEADATYEQGFELSDALEIFDDLYIGTSSGTDDDYIYFDQSKLEFLSWDDDPGEFDLSDDLDVAGHLAVGTAAIDVNVGLNLYETFTDVSATTFGIFARVDLTPTAADSQGHSAITGTAYAFNTTKNFTNIITAVQGDAATILYNTGTISWLRSFEALSASAYNVGGTITNRAGLYVADPAGIGPTTMTNNFGIYLEPQTVGTNKFGICFDCDGTFGTQTVGTGIQWGTDGTTTQNVAMYRSANGTWLVEDGAGTDLISISTTTLSANLSAQIGGTAQRLCHSGADAEAGVLNIGDCGAIQADLAEYYGVKDDAGSGDLVVLEGEAKEADYYGGKTSIAYVRKSSKPYENAMIGVVSTNPSGEVLGEAAYSLLTNPKPVALLGRTPLKVSAENGPIEIGDPLTSSSIPGVAMRATESGPIIGKALEPFGSAQINTDGNTDETQIGKIIVFVNVGYYIAPTDYTQISDGLNTDTQISGFTDPLMNGISDIAGFFKDGLANLGLFVENGIAQVGELIAEKITAKKARIDKLEMVDQATGKIYCTWIENGEWVKVIGECSEVDNQLVVEPPANEPPAGDEPPPSEEPPPQEESPAEEPPIGEPVIEEPASADLSSEVSTEEGASVGEPQPVQNEEPEITEPPVNEEPVVDTPPPAEPTPEEPVIEEPTLAEPPPEPLATE